MLRTRSLNLLTPKVPVVILMKLFFPDTLEAMLLDTVAAAAANRPTSSRMTTGRHQEDTRLASTPKDSRPSRLRTKEEKGMPHNPHRGALIPAKPMDMAMASQRPDLPMLMSAHIPGLQKLPVIVATPPQARHTQQEHTRPKDRTPGTTKASLRLMHNQWTLYTVVATSIRQLARQTTLLRPNRFTSMTPSTRLQAKPKSKHKTPVRPPPPPSVHRLKQDTVEHSRATIAIATIARAAPDTVGDRINLTTLMSNDVSQHGPQTL